MGNDTHLIQPERDGDYTVVLPCSQDHFKDFVSGLLGKPQTIECSFPGWYEINKNNLINIYHLVNQRVFQQNGGTLLQFTAKIIYQDKSSVLLTSFEDFENYEEVKPLVSISIHLTWAYLIQFQDKQYPEKQELELSYLTGLTERRYSLIGDSEKDVIGSLPTEFSANGEFRLRINHTARSWGVDIEALISAHLRTLRKYEHSFFSFIWQHSDGIGFWAGFLFFIVSLASAYLIMISFGETQLAAAQEIISLGTSAGELDRKMQFVINTLLSGVWPRFTLGLITFVIVLLVIAIVIGLFISFMASNKPISVLLLTNKSMEYHELLLKERTKGWIHFALSLFGGILTGVIANYLFRWLIV